MLNEGLYKSHNEKDWFLMDNKLKVGVVTLWWSNDNYGQLLQCYALQYYLRSKGCDAFLIRYNPTLDRKDKSFLFIIRRFLKLFNISKSYRYILRLIRNAKNTNRDKIFDRKFDHFRRNYIASSEIVYSKESLKKSPPMVDILITGSDQVWSGLNDVFFLNFGAKGTKRASFAASFGNFSHHESDEKLRRCKEWIERIDFISVREHDGLKICNTIGRVDAKLFLDPTLMLTMTEYRKIAMPIPEEKKFCFVYMIDSSELTPVTMNEIQHYLLEKGLDLKYVASQRRFDDFSKIYPTINEFISYIEHAEVVITNSFHGAVFSILFNKEFVVLPKGTTTNGRMTTLLETLGISNRFVHSLDEIENAFNRRINYLDVNDRLSIKREENDFEFSSFLDSVKWNLN